MHSLCPSLCYFLIGLNLTIPSAMLIDWISGKRSFGLLYFGGVAIIICGFIWCSLLFSSAREDVLSSVQTDLTGSERLSLNDGS